MSKRPSDSPLPLTAPHLKQARKRSPLPDARQKVSLGHMIELSDDGFERLHHSLGECLQDEQQVDYIASMVYHLVSFRVMASPRKHELVKLLVTNDQFMENVNQDEQFMEMLTKAAKYPPSQDDLTSLMTYDAFWKTPESPPMPALARLEPPPSVESQHKAIEDSWNAAYVDLSPLDGLVKHISGQVDAQSLNLYGRYCSIIQSSGMGKSRLLDEFSRYFFMIPINLRAQGTGGFPPPDNDARAFLTGEISRPGTESDLSPSMLARVRSFLWALFKIAEEALLDMDDGDRYARIEKFRELMSKDQKMDLAGEYRRGFYSRVVAAAQARLFTTEADISNKLGQLRMALNRNTTSSSRPGGSRDRPHLNQSHISAESCPEKYVDVFISFDEAHTLAETNRETKESCFIVLRRVLSSLSTFPLYAIFLSTTGKVTQFARPRALDPSSRISDGEKEPPHPYIYLGFDQLMQSCKVFDRWYTLKGVTSLECAAHMGRPLWGARYDCGDEDVHRTLLDFAQQKLLCATSHGELTLAQTYAVLSQRLALGTSMAKYRFHSKNPLKALSVMQEQIANHMRVAVAMEGGIETLRGIAPSEPILSEAASRIMLKRTFSLPQALSRVLDEHYINTEDRKELIVASLFTWARDQAVAKQTCLPEEQLCPPCSVIDLLRELFPEDMANLMLDHKPSFSHTGMGGRFKDEFGSAMMHFNHFIRPQEALGRLHLLHFMARGAAALRARCQSGYDMVLPFLHGCKDRDASLDVKNVGFIMVKVKQDSVIYDRPALDELFSTMDPYSSGLADHLDKRLNFLSIPIIRIVFLLSGKGAPSRQHKTSRSSSRSTPIFTTYDYVCEGLSGLGPTSGDPKWQELVRDEWGSFYENVPGIPGVLRSQLPGCSRNAGHYTSWSSKFVEGHPEL